MATSTLTKLQKRDTITAHIRDLKKELRENPESASQDNFWGHSVDEQLVYLDGFRDELFKKSE